MNFNDRTIGRCLRSGLKPNFNPDFKPNVRRRKLKDKKVPKPRLKIPKKVSKDKKLFLTQTVKLERLRSHVIRKHDKDFYKRYSHRLKEEKQRIKYSKIKQILVKSQTKAPNNPQLNESPKRMLLWSSPNSQVKQQTTYPVLRSHVRRLANCDDRENSLMCLPEFCRNLNLISKNDFNRMNTKQMNTTFSIRHIAKSEDYSVNANNQIEINYEYLIGSVEQKENSNSTQIVSKKKKNKKKIWTVNKVKQKYNKIEKQKQRMTDLWKKSYLKCLSMYEMSSPMGQRVFTSLKTHKLEAKKVQSMVTRYEKFCKTRLRLSCKEQSDFNKWKLRRIERLTTGHEFSQRDRCLTSYQYSFTKRQRLEKALRIKTGIDWKSRLLALNCSPKTEVVINKMKFCPICGQNIEYNHSCDNSASDCDSKSTSSVGSNRKSPTISPNSQRVLRHQNKMIGETSVKTRAKTSPKRQKSISPKVPRVLSLDLDA